METEDGKQVHRDELVRLRARNQWFRFKWLQGNNVTLWGPVNKTGGNLGSAQFVSQPVENVIIV